MRITISIIIIIVIKDIVITVLVTLATEYVCLHSPLKLKEYMAFEL